jgi:hypothetical protein
MRPAIETTASKDFSLISEYYVTGKSEKLPEHHKRILDRWRSADRILMKFPKKSIAARKLQAEFPEISIRQAQIDIDNACKFWNIVNPADKGFLQRWLIDNLQNSILSASTSDLAKARDRATLERLISAIKDESIDPKLMEKNTVNIQFNINNNNNIIFSEKELNTIPLAIRQKLLSLTQNTITETDAIEIMNS